MKLRFKCTASRTHTHKSVGRGGDVSDKKITEVRLEACGGEAFQGSPSGTLTFVVDRAGVSGLKENALYDIEITDAS